jgi:hypothetical protein
MGLLHIVAIPHNETPIMNTHVQICHLSERRLLDAFQGPHKNVVVPDMEATNEH